MFFFPGFHADFSLYNFADFLCLSYRHYASGVGGSTRRPLNELFGPFCCSNLRQHGSILLYSVLYRIKFKNLRLL